MKSTSVSDWKINAVFVAVIALIIVIAVEPELISSMFTLETAGMITFKTMLISILLEAMPFLLLGVVVSSIMHVFIPEDWIRRLIPKNPVVGVFAASLLGILFPVCECGLIPIVRRLMAKGMPLYAGVAFILAGPVVNPVVYSATLVAFRTRPEMVYARMGLAVTVAVVVGLFVYFFIKHNPLKQRDEETVSQHATGVSRKQGLGTKLDNAARHSVSEFFDMGKYLIIGSFLAALIQSFVPRSALIEIGQGEVISHIFMMGFAFILSLCSTADAFVAASFVSTFSAGSLLTFLVFGPMVDLKGTLMLLSIFKARFVWIIIALITVIVPIGALLLDQFYL